MNAAFGGVEDPTELHLPALDRAIQQTIRTAWALRASDIHIEPEAGGTVTVQYRVDGDLRFGLRLTDPQRAQAFARELKRIAGFNLSLLGIPQDSRFSVHDPPLDFRAALLPSAHGEAMTLRLLPRNLAFDLDEYPMPSQARSDLRDALARGEGLVLLSGPTGSGKTTLLNQAVADLAADGRKKIWTAEDPIEHSVQAPGVMQCEVRRPEVTFAALLRGFLRADPDVILVGEIRDAETAAMATHAAKTGHLVLSTVHVGRVDRIASRLGDLGVPAYDIDHHLVWGSTQRLVPAICSRCRQPDPEGQERWQQQCPDLPIGQAFRGQGCEACGGRQTNGRHLLMGWAHRPGARSYALQVPLTTAVQNAVEQGAIDVDRALALV